MSNIIELSLYLRKKRLIEKLHQDEKNFITYEIHERDGSTTYVREPYNGELPIEAWK